MTTVSKHLQDIPALVDHPYEWAWNLHPTNKMSIVIYHWSQPVMSFSLHEAIESSSRNEVLKHIVECDNTPWLKSWQEEKHACLINLLAADYNASV
jgi:hypothetical protein